MRKVNEQGAIGMYNFLLFFWGCCQDKSRLQQVGERSFHAGNDQEQPYKEKCVIRRHHQVSFAAGRPG